MTIHPTLPRSIGIGAVLILCAAGSAPNVAAPGRFYRELGFSEVGMLVDRFRIEGESIDDVIMTLELGSLRRREPAN